MDFFAAQIWELRRSKPLRVLGFVLSLTHVFTFYEWTHLNSQLFKVESGSPLCWEFFSQCHNLIFLTPSQLESFFYSYMIFAAVAALCFISERLLGIAWTLLFITFFSKIYIGLLDASLFDNLDAITMLAQASFLFIPKKTLLPMWILLSSFWISALLKFNTNWLATFWLSEHFPELPTKLLEWLAIGVLFIEIFFPIFFVLNSKATFRTSMILLLLWSGYNYLAKDWVSAGTGLGLVFYFWSVHRERNQKHHDTFYQSYTRPEPSWIWLPIGLTTFAALQISGWIIGSREVRTEPFQLTSPRVPQDCRHYSYMYSPQQGEQILEDLTKDSKNCDEKIRIAKVKSLCTGLKDPKMQISSFFLSRNITQSQFSRRFESFEVCDARGNQ